jgi:GT2 family glycosyltransferase
MKLSVIIVNYNVKYFLEQCLHAVQAACQGMDAEVIVVDNHSVDGSVEMIRSKFPGVTCICNSVNAGFSKANNQALHVAAGEYVLLLNPDTLVEEDTLKKVVEFMDQHPDGGALGVKMIDGSGRFLPESKRGLPTPSAAFFKMTGLAALFPRSRVFSRYHLRYLDENMVHAVDVLSGAFMLIRSSVLQQTGFLDEDYFMYGEDIDLSYRIQKAGYTNYYFPLTRIIHYKGESTRKTSINYVVVFYRAMIIFARKHFTRQHASLFSFLISMAIYLRAGLAVVSRLLRKSFLPLLDAALLFGGMYFLKEYWSRNLVVHYPPLFTRVAVPAYILVWMMAVFLSGGYEKPVRLARLIRGVFSGTILILVIYALLPETYRFSRALILLGSVWASISMTAVRLVLSQIAPRDFALETKTLKRLLIAGGGDEARRVLSLLKMSGSSHNFIGFVLPDTGESHAARAGMGDLGQYVLGNITNLKDIVEVFRIDEVIFCARDISSNQIIRHMAMATGREVEFKIAPPESMFIIGSSSPVTDGSGELYIVDINSISKGVNRRNKRLVDLAFGGLFLILSPLLIFFQRDAKHFFGNLLRVISGKASWVGYYRVEDPRMDNLPPIRPGILSPLDALERQHLDNDTVIRLNGLYAKDYRVYADLNILMSGWRKLGRRWPAATPQ